ncbi:hypothetical protein L484_010947 [Morus notabilis]|uniref:Uncharacterized protein n=1 Tax=Morus notabilis TaxID=981085 RepID=W9RAT9_9ROSA|nr:hypothetical protein L484_010947 [Morus notabilis]
MRMILVVRIVMVVVVVAAVAARFLLDPPPEVKKVVYRARKAERAGRVVTINLMSFVQKPLEERMELMRIIVRNKGVKYIARGRCIHIVLKIQNEIKTNSNTLTIPIDGNKKLLIRKDFEVIYQN